MSRYVQLLKLADTAQEQRDALGETLARMGELCSEVQDWYDAMTEGWQAGERGEKASRVAELELDPETLLADVDGALSDARDALGG